MPSRGVVCPIECHLLKLLLICPFFCFKGFMQVSYNGLAGGLNPIENSLSNRGEENMFLVEATSASPKDAYVQKEAQEVL